MVNGVLYTVLPYYVLVLFLPISLQRNDGTYPSMCTNEQLDTNLLESLSDELSDKWPNVKSDIHSQGQYTSFWKHEWEKHGT